MTRYAENTKVSVASSREEIESILGRYGADGFGYMQESNSATVMFRAYGLTVRFVISMPDRNDPAFFKTPGGRKRRDGEAAYKAWEQACRQRWRALALVIKAKLEAVEAGITTFEYEFLAHIAVPGTNHILGEYVTKPLRQAYEEGRPVKGLLTFEE